MPLADGHPRPGAVCCSAPFCAGHGLIAATSPNPVGMHLDVAGVDHQPLKVGIVNHRLQKLGPDVSVPPAAKPPMGVLPVPVVRGQIPPQPAPYLIRGSAGAQNPEHCVQKPAIVPVSRHGAGSGPGGPPCQLPRASGAASAPRPDPKGHADDAMRSSPDTSHRSRIATTYHQLPNLTTLLSITAADYMIG